MTTTYFIPANKDYTVRSIESFQDVTNILKCILPYYEPDNPIYIKIINTGERYKWNYITRTFDRDGYYNNNATYT